MADFDDFDDLNFKPVTKGLGFHHGESKSPKKFNRVSPLEKSTIRKNSISKGVSPNVVSKGELSSFYNNDISVAADHDLAVSALRDVKSTKNDERKVFWGFRIFAWLIDMVVIGLLNVATMYAFFLLQGKSFAQLLHVLSYSDRIVFGIIFFSLFYIIYFSVLDLQATVGKNIFKIRVKSELGQLSLIQTFGRSIITLLSLALLFSPLLIALQDKLTQTHVVRK